MFYRILSFELRFRAKRISTYIYFVIFLLVGYFAIIYGGPLKRTLGAGIGNVKANAPFVLYYLITMMSHLGILITAAFFGYAGQRDFKENFFELHFSYPIRKFDYFAGKFTAALISALFVFSGVGIGAFIAAGSSLIDPGKIARPDLFAHIQPYMIGVLPNILFAGALFFSFALLTRKIFPVYVGSIIILTGYLIGVNLAQTLENNFLASLIDPFGQLAVRGFYEYWTAAQKNILLVPFEGNLLLNRMFWCSLAVALLIIAYRKFSFSYLLESRKQKLPDSRQTTIGRMETVGRKIWQIKTATVFGFKNNLKQMRYTMFYEFKGLVQNIYFLSILFCGILVVLSKGFKHVGFYRGVQTYPVTYQVLDLTASLFYLFMLIIIIFCSGELVWRERDKNVREMYDAMPVPEWVPFGGKLGALMMVQVLIMFVIMFSGIFIQVMHGYYNFELGLYIKELFGMRLIYFLLISVFAMFVQVMVNNKYLGHFLMVILYMLVIDDETLPSLGLEHNLYRFGGVPKHIYSQMNGYGPFVKPAVFFNLYWSCFAVLLIILAILFWVRGKDTSFKERIKSVKTRLTKAKLIAAGTALLFFISLGGFIYYNTNILNEYDSAYRSEKRKVDFEKRYKKYENTPLPRIIDIKMNVDIYPYQKRVSSKGRLTLKNKTKSGIREVFVKTFGKINKLSLDAPGSLTESSKVHGVHIYRLNNPMKPGEKMALDFEIELAERGFKNNIAYQGYINKILVENGTILESIYLIPGLCYDPVFNELEDNEKRQKYGLNPKQAMPSRDDEKARMNTFFSKDSDRVGFEALMSTSKDQTALTSGELIKDWVEGERRYFHYKVPGKVIKGFPFISARYCVKKDKWRDINIEIYYHKGHEYNLDLMIKSVKKSLAYFTKNFSPYQYKEIKIVEYPRYKMGAEAYQGLIPFSEGYGFIAKFDNKNVDYMFRVTAHEVGHQWWGHQVAGANVEGMFLMLEPMAQYSALMVIKNEYDRLKINKYIQARINSYLKGRARETRKEVPLALSNLSAHYVNYEKGMVVMNALQEYIGEDNLNAALGKYIKKVGFQGPPYTTSREFIQYIKEATPVHLEYIITDMLETITLYENRAVRAIYKKTAEGKYLVKLKFVTNKLRADGLGNEKSIAINDYIAFGIFGADGEELYLKKHKVNPQTEELEFIVDKIPAKAGIDPYYYLIDKNTGNNITGLHME